MATPDEVRETADDAEPTLEERVAELERNLFEANGWTRVPVANRVRRYGVVGVRVPGLPPT